VILTQAKFSLLPASLVLNNLFLKPLHCWTPRCRFAPIGLHPHPPFHLLLFCLFCTHLRLPLDQLRWWRYTAASLQVPREDDAPAPTQVFEFVFLVLFACWFDVAESFSSVFGALRWFLKYDSFPFFFPVRVRGAPFFVAFLTLLFLVVAAL